MPKILVIDDSRNLRQMVSSYLEQEGWRVVTAANGREGLRLAEQESPDLIILDLMMPEMGGYEFLREVGPSHRTPIIVLTARMEESDKVLGLELGADDYVTKPFSLRELSARVRAVLRRANGEAKGDDHLLQAGDVALNRETRQATVAAKPVDLTPSEFGLLEALMFKPGRVWSRLDLLDHLQGNTYEGYERTIDVHIRNLRAKIEPDPKNPRYIETVYGAGYRFAVGK
ncbi:MAG: response regulator transcription factor [Caldilineales bacterium]|nr:response regulator transcription factor [Caldilineales bacterium]MCW5858888.1 response regulator transcription factor [Caldilineales bacterium]